MLHANDTCERMDIGRLSGEKDSVACNYGLAVPYCPRPRKALVGFTDNRTICLTVYSAQMKMTQR
jgi:hypothetical protein